ncbi:MAG: alpha/beta fold hydrolase [archaeon]|nr:alpha/beta fold hydrolase [archaeon]
MSASMDSPPRESSQRLLIDERLEAELVGESLPTPWIAVLTHPHPRFGGSMDNNVIFALLASLRRLQIATLRFNFSGVGRSTGSASWTGSQERDDVRAALRYALSVKPKVLLIGYSFGAAVGLSVASEFNLEAVVAIAYPKGFFSSLLLSSLYVDPGSAPKLFLLGDSDNFTSERTLRRFVEDSVSEPKELHVFQGSGIDHFFAGHEHLVTRKIKEFLLRLGIGQATQPPQRYS